MTQFITKLNKDLNSQLQIIKNNSSIVATIALHIIKALAFIPTSETSTLSKVYWNKLVNACVKWRGL